MIFPYKKGSASAKELALALSMKQIKRENSSFKGREDKLVINWGAKVLPEEVEKCVVLNSAEAVSLATNKLSFFEHVHEKLSVPEFTTDSIVARVWVEEGCTVVVRETLNGHSGEGICILEEEDDFDQYDHNQAKLYVKYIPKKDEYRVHVVAGEAIDIRRKALQRGYVAERVNWKVRSHDNGFIFAKDGFEAPEQVTQQAVLACELCGLDFGAVDVIYNNFRDKAYVLEVNTAPGLEGSTVDNYASAFEKLMGKPQKKENPFLDVGAIVGEVNLRDINIHPRGRPLGGGMWVVNDGEGLRLHNEADDDFVEIE